MADHFTDQEYHDLKAALADFFMYMSSIEVTIENIFVLTLGIDDLAAKAVLPNIQSVSKRVELIISVSEHRNDTKEFQDLIKGIRAKYEPLRAVRNSYAHRLSQNEKRNCLAYHDKAGAEKALTGPTIQLQLSEAREVFHDLTLLTLDVETLRMVAAMTEDGLPRKSTAAVIREAYEARGN